MVAKDKVMGLMKGKSDPYVKIRIGGKTFKSDVIKGTLNPNWNEMYEVRHYVNWVEKLTKCKF